MSAKIFGQNIKKLRDRDKILKQDSLPKSKKEESPNLKLSLKLRSSNTIRGLTKLFLVIIAIWNSPALGDEVRAKVATDDCLNWFTRSKLKPGKGCLGKCVTIPTDMSSFDCPNSCTNFCDSSLGTSALFNISDLYPGLTPAEKALAAEMPSKTLKAYQLSWKAEQICLGMFPASLTNDASDGCRHYMWSALMTKDFGDEIASKFLNAHEQDPEQPSEEKAMDIENNKLGLSAASLIIKSKKFSEDELSKKFQQDLKSGKIRVLKQGDK